ncbi:uncharacterized protein LOC129275676 [Lytechinus pictus]|uniref:uncharacterized protein LOC129275676 n=1 Tax=Lytechinus pictus TaxID=7653 RepID=UPI0030BA18A9
MTTFGYMEANSMAWLVTIPAVAVENLVALVIISSRKRWKSPDVLLFSITLGHLLSLLLPLLLYAVITFTKTPWSDGSCKFLVWCVMSFRIVGAVNIAFISLDRVWTLKWPSSYRSHNSSRQTARTAVFMWLFGVAIGTIPLISWSNLEVNQTCSLVLNIAGYGYAMCIVIIILGSVIISTGCICTIVVNVAFVWPLLEESSDPKDTIPHIVIESETGERTSAVVGSRDSQNKQIYYLVSTVVVLYFCINGLPFVVINIIAFTEDVPSYWMSVTISWCSVVSAFLHPPLLVLLCNRYKKVYVRFFRYIGESCGCTHVTPARPSLNGITRQETFDSLDDFSSDEDDKLHFPSPDWSDRSFTGSFEETPGPSSQPTIEVTAPTTTNFQTVTVVEHSQVVQNGKIPPKKSQRTPLQSGKYTPKSSPDAVSPTKTGVEYDNAAFVVEDENKKGKSKKQRSPKLTPEQKRAIWQGHKGARKRLEALKQASAERGSSSHSSKGKKTRSKTRQEKREKDADNIMKDSIPNKNKHKRLERISTRQHSLDSLTVPTKRRAPMLSSRSFDQPDNIVTIKVDIENNDRQNNFTDFLREDKEKSLSVKPVKSEGETSRGKKKRKKPEKKEDRTGRKENFKKDNLDTKLQRDQKLTVSPNSSPSAHERRKTDGNSLRGPRFEISRENYNSDFSSFGSGELYDIPEESPEEILVESSGWSPSTVRAIRTQHRNELEPTSDGKNRDGNTVPRKHKERERPRQRSKLDLTEPGLQVKDKRPTKGLLSRQLSQDHSRTPEVNLIEMTELKKPGSIENIPFGHLHDNNDEMSFNEYKAVAETAVDADQSKYYTSGDLQETHVKQGDYGVEREHSILDDRPTDLPADAGHLREEAEHRGFTLHTQAWASLNSPPGKTLTELEEVPSEQKGHLSKSRSTGDRPSAKDLRERYRKSHLSMAAIFESIQDDSQEVVYL